MRPTRELLVLLLCALVLLGSMCEAGPEDLVFCEREPRYESLADIQIHAIWTLDDWLQAHGEELTKQQLAELDTAGNLVGTFSLERPIKHPDGTVEMPLVWLPELPPDHPWLEEPMLGDVGFFAWFEIFIVDALLWDPEDPEHVEWANAYLDEVADVGLIDSIAGFDSACPEE